MKMSYKICICTLFVLILVMYYMKARVSKQHTFQQQNQVNFKATAAENFAIKYKNAVNKLISDSHLYATKEFCKEKDYAYNETTKTCQHTQDSCLNESSPQNYLEWHNGKCILTMSIVKDKLCTNGLVYNQGNVTCDDKGMCKNDIQIGNCIITKPYCDKFQVDFDSSGAGNCTTSDAQKYAEMFLSTSTVRNFKKIGSDLADGKVGEAVAQIILLPVTQFTDAINKLLGTENPVNRDPFIEGTCLNPATKKNFSKLRAFNNLYDNYEVGTGANGMFLDKTSELYNNRDLHISSQSDDYVWDLSVLSNETCLAAFSGHYGDQYTRPEIYGKLNWTQLKHYQQMQYCTTEFESCDPNDVDANKFTCCYARNDCFCKPSDPDDLYSGFSKVSKPFLMDAVPDLFFVNFERVKKPSCTSDPIQTLSRMFNNVFGMQLQEYLSNTTNCNNEPWTDPKRKLNICYKFALAAGSVKADNITSLPKFEYKISFDDMCMQQKNGINTTSIILSTFSASQTFCGANVLQTFQNPSNLSVLSTLLKSNPTYITINTNIKTWFLTYMCLSGTIVDANCNCDCKVFVKQNAVGMYELHADLVQTYSQTSTGNGVLNQCSAYVAKI